MAPAATSPALRLPAVKTGKPANAQQLVRENVKFLIQQLEAGHKRDPYGIPQGDDCVLDLSFGNALAIAGQRPETNRVAGMFAWSQLGRFVNKGERGIAILAPVIGKSVGKTDSSELKPEIITRLLGFRRVFLWSEEQTHGFPLREPEQATCEAGVYLNRMRSSFARASALFANSGGRLMV